MFWRVAAVPRTLVAPMYEHVGPPGDEARGARDLLIELEFRRGALRRGLREALRGAIQEGRLLAGTRLPSSRRLAADLGVSRGVVADTYDQLVSEGYLAARPRTGTVVAPVAGAAPPEPEAPPPQWRFDLVGTTPEVALFPRRAWIRAMEAALRSAPDGALSYTEWRGRIELRQALGAYLARVRGVRVDPGRIVVTQGFTQALDLVCRALGKRGATRIAFETPSIRELWETATASGLTLVGCPVDGSGLRTDDLWDLDVGAVVVSPAHQYPMGVVLSPERRLALLDWASRTGGLVIEDDYDAEFRYDRTPVGSMQGLDPGRVVHVGTASKTLAPGVRLGWMSLPAYLLEEIRAEKRMADHGSPVLDQLALAELIVGGGYERHVARARHVYRRRRDHLVRAIAIRRPDLRLQGATAGTHALLPLDPDVDDLAIADAASERGIRVRALTSLRLAPGPERGLVLGYGRLSDGQIEPAMEALLPLLPQPSGARRSSA